MLPSVFSPTSTTTRKIFVIDTSALIYDPTCYENLTNADIIIPIVVLEELDKVKSFTNEGGKKARMAIRSLDGLCDKSELHSGIKLPNNSTLKIDVENYGAIGSDPKYGDNRLLSCAMAHNKKKKNVCVLTRDINLRVRAKSLGMEAVAPNKTRDSDIDQFYKGIQTIVDDECGKTLKEAGVISIDPYDKLKHLLPNEYVLFTNAKGKGVSVGRRVSDQILIVKDKSPWDLALKNHEQLCLCDAILNPNIPLVSVTGISGGGKTLVSVASALELVLNQHKYKSLILYKSAQNIDNQNLGFIPGTLEDKLTPIMGSVFDSFAFLFPDKNKDGWKSKLYQYMSNGTIQMEAINFARGRSFNDTLILLEEGQNLDHHAMKLLLTRVGMNSKIIITGDTEQIDNSKLSRYENGLSNLIETFKTSSLAAHVTITSGVRSPLSALASNIF